MSSEFSTDLKKAQFFNMLKPDPPGSFVPSRMILPGKSPAKSLPLLSPGGHGGQGTALERRNGGIVL